MDCGVCVFGALTGLSREEILHDLPDAAKGKTVDEWETYMRGKGFDAVPYQPEEAYPLPCAHLVESGAGHHWIYQAADEGIHDPSPVFQHMPPKLLKLSAYRRRVLTIAVRPKDAAKGRTSTLPQ